MVEDESETSEFVWGTDAHDNGQDHAVVHGTVGVSSDPEDVDGTTIQMELPDSLADDVISLYGDLDSEFYQRYSERLEPNKLFWENGVRLLLDNEDELRERIGLE